MPDTVALDIYGDREAGDVGGHCFGMHRQGGGIAAESQRTDAQSVYPFQYISFKLGDFGVLVGLPVS